MPNILYLIEGHCRGLGQLPLRSYFPVLRICLLAPEGNWSIVSRAEGIVLQMQRTFYKPRSLTNDKTFLGELPAAATEPVRRDAEPKKG